MISQPSRCNENVIALADGGPFYFKYRDIKDIRKVPKAAKFGRVPSNKTGSILLQNCFVNLCIILLTYLLHGAESFLRS